MPLTSIIRDKWTGYRKIRIAVMGTKGSGKTVFLSAIANHLSNHSPENFNLGGLRVSHHAIAGTTLDGFPLFDSAGALAAFERGEWPAKTTNPSVLAMPLTLTDETKKGRREDVRLEILDIPGERIADFPMMGHSYREWCNWLQNAWAGPNGTSEAYRRYLGQVSAMNPGQDGDTRQAAKQALFDAYRDFIADGYANYAAHVTPSTVKLELDGTTHGGTPAAFREAIGGIPLGFRDDAGQLREFAPLPDACFGRESPWRHLVREFSKNYDKYAAKIVRPMEGWLKDANALFYLVDALSLLQAGSRAWFSEKSYGEAAIRTLCPRREGNLLSRMGRGLWGMLLRTKVRDIRLVATKADRVLSGDRDNLRRLVPLRSTTTAPTTSPSGCSPQARFAGRLLNP